MRKQSYQGTARDGSSHDEFLEVDVALDAGSGIWFPSAWHYERKNDGEFRTSQDVTITDVVLNKPLPEHLFDMKDIKILPVGVNVRWNATMIPPPAEGRLFWDGNDVVSHEDYISALIKTPHDKSRVRRIICFNVGIVFLLLAACLWSRYRKLQAQA